MKINSQLRISTQNDHLASITREIIYLADPDIIFLLSASYNYQLVENIFNKSLVQEFSNSQYDLLLLSEITDNKTLAEKEIALISRLTNSRNLKLHLMDIKSFNERVSAGNEFENYILLNAVLCHNKGKIPLSSPRLPESLLSAD